LSIVRENARSLDCAELPKDGNSAPLGMTNRSLIRDSLEEVMWGQPPSAVWSSQSSTGFDSAGQRDIRAFGPKDSRRRLSPHEPSLPRTLYAVAGVPTSAGLFRIGFRAPST